MAAVLAGGFAAGHTLHVRVAVPHRPAQRPAIPILLRFDATICRLLD
jgi:hypothetical protein